MDIVEKLREETVSITEAMRQRRLAAYEIERLRVDAERYRWLRESDVIDWDSPRLIAPLSKMAFDESLALCDLLDAVVDAALHSEE